MTPRRIAYVVRVFPKVSETFVANELAELRRRGIEVRIFSVCEPMEELRHGVIARAGLAERTVYDRQRFSEVLQEFKPDLVHAHFATKATAVGRRLAERFDIPFTFTAHRYDIYDKAPADFAERAAAARAVITVSEANLRYIVENFGVPENKIHVIPCGVDTARFRPSGGPGDPPHIVCVARLARCKNQRLLLEACALLQARGVNFHCVLIGDGPCRDDLVRLRKQLGLVPLVEMLGAAEQDQVLAWWQRATVAVLSSESEGMPVSLMEAGACGVPVVATAVGGVPELIADGLTGIVTPAGSASALAEALERLLRNRKLAARMGAAARRRVETQFSLARQVDNLLSLWGHLLNGGTARGYTGN
jgi:colanic acid/amylovoran biosynthesis glycosyltransferase